LSLGAKEIPFVGSATPRYVINSDWVEEHTQYMKYHALIGNFMELFPSNRDLVKWIKYWWKLKFHFDLQLGSIGFFTMNFHNIKDQYQEFENGSYLFNLDGLYLRF